MPPRSANAQRLQKKSYILHAHARHNYGRMGCVDCLQQMVTSFKKEIINKIFKPASNQGCHGDLIAMSYQTSYQTKPFVAEIWLHFVRLFEDPFKSAWWTEFQLHKYYASYIHQRLSLNRTDFMLKLYWILCYKTVLFDHITHCYRSGIVVFAPSNVTQLRMCLFGTWFLSLVVSGSFSLAPPPHAC